MMRPERLRLMAFAILVAMILVFDVATKAWFWAVFTLVMGADVWCYKIARMLYDAPVYPWRAIPGSGYFILLKHHQTPSDGHHDR
jgi:hypothetical protein